jgi:hypothetical protein
MDRTSEERTTHALHPVTRTHLDTDLDHTGSRAHRHAQRHAWSRGHTGSCWQHRRPSRTAVCGSRARPRSLRSPPPQPCISSAKGCVAVARTRRAVSRAGAVDGDVRHQHTRLRARTRAARGERTKAVGLVCTATRRAATRRGERRASPYARRGAAAHALEPGSERHRRVSVVESVSQLVKGSSERYIADRAGRSVSAAKLRKRGATAGMAQAPSAEGAGLGGERAQREPRRPGVVVGQGGAIPWPPLHCGVSTSARHAPLITSCAFRCSARR